MSDLLERIKRTARKYGMVYPVLVNQHDCLINGRHRIAAWKRWPRKRIKVKTPYDLLAVRTIANSVRRTISGGERAQEIRKMGGFLEKSGLKTKQEQAQKIAQDTGLSENYVRDLLKGEEEGEREIQAKPPLTGEDEGEVQAKAPLTEAKRAAVEEGKKGAEFGRLGGRPVSWLTVCPSCGYKGKRREFGRIKAE